MVEEITAAAGLSAEAAKQLDQLAAATCSASSVPIGFDRVLRMQRSFVSIRRAAVFATLLSCFSGLSHATSTLQKIAETGTIAIG